MKVQDGEDFRDATPEEEALLKQGMMVSIPQVISRRQGIQQLIIEGLIDDVQPLIDGIEEPLDRRLAQAYWDESTEFERGHGMVVRIGYGLGKDDAGLDEMFKNASKL